MRKKILSILVVVILLNLTVLGYANEENFDDIHGHWAETTIKNWINLSLINGYPDGTFRPNEQITKAEFITLVNRIFGYNVKAEDNYEDIEEKDWYSSHTAIAKANVYMSWYNQEALAPNQAITRQEVSAILATIMRLKLSNDLTALENFTDGSTIPEWSKTYLDAIVSSGYMNGYPDNTVRAEGNITRAESVVMLDRVMGRLINETGTYGPLEGTETIKGNVTVNVSNTILKNIIIEGDLVLSAGIGDGDIDLNNIQVKGRTIVNGGGENSIKITGSQMGDIIVLKVGGKVRIVSKDSVIGQVAQNSPGKLEGDFKNAEIVVLTEDLILDGNFTDIIIETTVELEITDKTKVDNLVVEKNAQGTTVFMEKGTQVGEITFEAGATVNGSGTIDKVNVNADDVKVQPEVNKVVVKIGVDGSDVTKSIPPTLYKVKISDFANIDLTDKTAKFSWTAAKSATSIKIEQSIVGADTWTESITELTDTTANSTTVTGLEANTSYDFRLVVTGGRNSGNSNTVTITTDYSPLTGTVAIDNASPKFDDILTAVLESSNNTGILSYQWVRDGSDISGATNNIYTVVEADIGKEVAVKITSSNETGTRTSANTAVVTKADVLTPSAPTMASKTDTEVTLTSVKGYEYSKDGLNWQDSPNFTGLTANTSYTFYQRVKETATHYASATSSGLSETTDYPPLTGTAAIDNTSPKFDDTLTATLENSNNTGTLSYQWMRDGSDISGGTNNTYTVVEADIGKELTVKITSSNETGIRTSANTAVVTKANVSAPSAPTMVSKTDTKVTLTGVDGYEYSKDGINWQDSPVFTGLTANTSYTFYQRVKETATHYVSATSTGLSEATDYPPLTGTAAIDNASPKFDDTLTAVLESSNNTGTLSYQWMRNGSNISSAINNVYTVVEADIGTVLAVKITSSNETGIRTSTNTAVVTKVNGPPALPAPTLEGKDDDEVCLVSVSFAEYSIDGTNWQDSPSFIGLTANTSYTFYQRIKETATHYASAASPGLSVTTDYSPLTGTAIIDNTSPKFNDTLTAILESSNNTGILSYQWTRNGSDISIATNNTYTVVEADIGTVLAVKITSSNETGTITSAITATVTKADGPTAPSAPTMASKTATTVTLTSVNGYEYSKNSTNWQDNPSFTGLTANTSYTFYQRVKETATHYASVASSVLDVTTDAPQPLTGTATIDNTSPKFDDTLTATLESSNNTGILSYQWTRNGSDISIATNNTYTVVEADIGKELAVKITSSSEIGTITSANTAVVTKADGPSAPSAPTMASKTDTTVTLTSVSGYEYSKGDTNWQDDPNFIGLTGNTSYTFYQRVKETATHYASATSQVLNVTTDETIPIGYLLYDNNNPEFFGHYIRGYDVNGRPAYYKDGTTYRIAYSGGNIWDIDIYSGDQYYHVYTNFSTSMIVPTTGWCVAGNPNIAADITLVPVY